MAEKIAKTENSEVTLKDVYAGYAEKATAKDPFEFSLLSKYDVEFTKDFKEIQKGHVMKGISKVAFDLYNANGVVSELKFKAGPTDAELDKEDEA